MAKNVQFLMKMVNPEILLAAIILLATKNI